VDWRREEGRPDNVLILRRYHQDTFETLIEAALAADGSHGA
jgi:purine nucleosidase